MHSGIRRLMPGHTLVWRDGKITTAPYWDLSFEQPPGPCTGEHAQTVRALLEDSIALHLRSDVPLGVFLSGGLDSSAVVALLSPGVSRGLKTFSVAYDFGDEYDETPYAREVSTAYATDHHEVRMTPKDFVNFVPSYIWHMDEPVTEAAAISLYYVAKLARKQVIVGLSGEGADELYAGYDFYRYNLVIERARNAVGGGVFRSLAALTRRMSRLAKARKYLNLAAQPLEARYRGISSYETEKKNALYAADFRRVAHAGNAACSSFIENLFERTRTWDPLSRMLYFDTKTWLVDDLLIKADRMTMANSIELRVPFLDHRVVEHAATLPNDCKVQRHKVKAVLKQALNGMLPRRILERKKMGFPTPLELMFRGELFEYAHDTLLSARAVGRGYFDARSVKTLLETHRRGQSANHREIWQLLVLEEWHQRFAY
jgi:asparagine synthase (glutamine-hydrolysing)